MVSGQTGMLILYIIIGFFGFITICCGTLFWIFWNRRKLIFTNFLNDTGQWERQSWKSKDLTDTFVYDEQTYKYDIKKCTRDKINRPIAHYFKGNPEQQIFNYSDKNKKIDIGTQNLTGKDFHVLMLSKVLRDIFQDEEVIQMLWIIIIEVALFGLITIIVVATHNPQVVLKADNQTISVISSAVKQAIMSGGVR
jgi:hypothetical protein